MILKIKNVTKGKTQTKKPKLQDIKADVREKKKKKRYFVYS